MQPSLSIQSSIHAMLNVLIAAKEQEATQLINTLTTQETELSLIKNEIVQEEINKLIEKTRQQGHSHLISAPTIPSVTAQPSLISPYPVPYLPSSQFPFINLIPPPYLFRPPPSTLPLAPPVQPYWSNLSSAPSLDSNLINNVSTAASTALSLPQTISTVQSTQQPPIVSHSASSLSTSTVDEAPAEPYVKVTVRQLEMFTGMLSKELRADPTSQIIKTTYSSLTQGKYPALNGNKWTNYSAVIQRRSTQKVCLSLRFFHPQIVDYSPKSLDTTEQSNFKIFQNKIRERSTKKNALGKRKRDDSVPVSSSSSAQLPTKVQQTQLNTPFSPSSLSTSVSSANHLHGLTRLAFSDDLEPQSSVPHPWNQTSQISSSIKAPAANIPPFPLLTPTLHSQSSSSIAERREIDNLSRQSMRSCSSSSVTSGSETETTDGDKEESVYLSMPLVSKESDFIFGDLDDSVFPFDVNFDKTHFHDDSED